MKLLIVLATVTLAQAGRLDREYLPPNSHGSPSSTNKLLASGRSSSISQTQGTSSNVNGYAQNTYSGFESGSNRALASLEGSAAVLRLDNKNDGETYSFAFETDNGFTAEETGVATNGVQAQGGYSYTGDDGKVYSIRYTADENGFVPQGDHIPTSPPIPEEILKALEQNARDEAAGIFDDGIYNEAKYSASSQQQYYNTNAQPINNNKNSGTVQKTYLPPSTQRNNYQRNGY